MQAETERLRTALAAQREAAAALELAERAAKAAKDLADEEAADARRARDELCNQSNKAGQVWQTMIDAKQEREKAVGELRERIAAVTAQRDARDVRAGTLQQEQRDVQAAADLAQKRVRNCCLTKSAPLRCAV